jgi:hypothetical protein
MDEVFGALEQFDFPIVDGRFGRDFEFVLAPEVMIFEKRDDFLVFVGGDHEIQISREARFKLADGVATDEHEFDVRFLEVLEDFDQGLAAFFLAHAGSIR